ncbi:MAG: lysine 2,3-aminomutase [Bacteroidota bacterium]|nr:lysine 2,3-aminomutase [Bacteroidota bacterium]
MNMKVLAPPGRAVPHVFSMEETPRHRFCPYSERNIHTIPQWSSLPQDIRFDIRVVSSVFPFRVNRYVVDELIDWSSVPEDPIFQLTFPQRGMLEPDDFTVMANLHWRSASGETIRAEAQRIRRKLNPHPAGQTTLNVPIFDGQPLKGVQHKYHETVLYFPATAQTCHAYCTYCFRWPQFVGIEGMRIAGREIRHLVSYLKAHPGVTNVLFTGGDPLVMRAERLAALVEPILDPSLDRIHTIRFGTKSPAYWPQRFVSDPDADDVLRLFERIVASGRSVALMVHYTHHRELETPIAREAVRRIRGTGAVIRSQSPVAAHINDTPGVWELLWREQVRLGIVPYYMFVLRDTGARRYFEVPLSRAVRIFREAYRHVNGLARTVRGPSMSTVHGKVEIAGVTEIAGERVFVLRFIQGRDPSWVGRPFFARFDPRASWFDDLRPAFGEPTYFFEHEAS